MNLYHAYPDDKHPKHIFYYPTVVYTVYNLENLYYAYPILISAHLPDEQRFCNAHTLSYRFFFFSILIFLFLFFSFTRSFIYSFFLSCCIKPQLLHYSTIQSQTPTPS